MSEAYEEILAGEVWMRDAPDPRHERICQRLHTLVASSLASFPGARLLAPRSIVEPRTGTFLRPDLAVVTAATGRLWLAAEIIHSGDHRPDTVVKKAIYEEVNLPRLWMVDPRYDNVEVYHATPYGLGLKGILASRQLLTEALLPNFQIAVEDLFA